MKQTAVEWLEEQFNNPNIPSSQMFFKQAKEMEKAEKDKQYERGFKDGTNHIKIIYNL